MKYIFLFIALIAGNNVFSAEQKEAVELNYEVLPDSMVKIIEIGGNIEIIKKFLIADPKNINVKCKDGYYLIEHILKAYNSQLFAFLIALLFLHNIDLQVQSAVTNDHVLFSLFNPNCVIPKEDKIIEFLQMWIIFSDQNVDQITNHRGTILAEAVLKSCKKVAEFLIQNGADVQAPLKSKKCPDGKRLVDVYGAVAKKSRTSKIHRMDSLLQKTSRKRSASNAGGSSCCF